MGTDAAPPRTVREWRRLQALHLKQQGWKQRDIAAALAVTEGAVSQWLAAAERSGEDALRARPAPGAPPRLTAAQRNRLPDFLWHGPEAYGFRGHAWTCARVAQVISEEFGVTYSKSQISRLLRALHWSPQLPIRRALQRDETAIAQWRSRVWPALRDHAQREARTLVFVDEAGFYLLPGVVKTYAPVGQRRGLTPEGKVYVLVREMALNGLHTVAFLEHLRRYAGERLLVIWDGSPIHRRAEVTDFLASPAGQEMV